MPESRRPRRLRIVAELVPVLLVLACLCASFAVVVSTYQLRATLPPKITQSPKPALSVPPPLPPPVKAASPRPAPPPEPPDDPTPKVLAKLAAEEAEEKAAASRADLQAEESVRARRRALNEASRRQRREQSVRARAAALDEKASRLEAEADDLAMERDVLEFERDAAKAALAKARASNSFAVLPYKGPNGTWRRPIPIECRNGTVTLQPKGPSCSLWDLSTLSGLRLHPLQAAVLRAADSAQDTVTPDGAACVPYILFIIRPDGIRPYYEALTLLEPAGIAYGYELVDSDLEIEYPELDDPKEWPETPPASAGVAGNVPGGPANRRGNSRERSNGPRPAGRGLLGDGNEPFDGGRPSRRGRYHGSFAELEANPSPRGRFGMADPVPNDGRVEIVPRGSGSSFDREAESAEETARGGGFGLGLAGEPGGPSSRPDVDPRPHANRSEGAGGEGFGSSRSNPAGGPGGPPGDGRGLGSSSTGQPEAERRPPIGWSGAERLTRSGGPHGTTDRPGSFAEFDEPPSDLPAEITDPTVTDGRQEIVPGGSNRSAAEALNPVASEGSSLVEGSGTGTGRPAPAVQGDRKPVGAPARPGRLPTSTSTSNPVAAKGATGGLGSDGHLGTPSLGMLGAPSAPPGAGSGTGADAFAPIDMGTPRPRRDLEMLVICRAKGIVIHPGKKVLDAETLKTDPGTIVRELQGVLAARRALDPMVNFRPTLRFLVEPGGNRAYWNVRRVMVEAGLDWPMALQVADPEIARLLRSEGL